MDALPIDVKSLKELGDRLFAKKRPLDQRNQNIADHFYVERADFTRQHDIGEEYASHLMTGYPSLTRRELANQIGTMLRPKGQPWMHISVGSGVDHEDAPDDRLSHDARRWLEWATKLQRNAMYDKVSGFTAATKQGDNDFAAFGQCAISTELNMRDNALLYRCWHLKDVAWLEDSYGQLAQIHRNWNPEYHELRSMQGKLDLHPDVVRDLGKSEHTDRPLRVRHVMVRSDELNDQRFARYPWVSLFIDCDHNHLMAQSGSWTRIYTLPRWATVSGSQYAYSPATVIALPDARLLQAMTLTLLNAGERAVDPPLIGVAEAIRGDINLFPGGFTSIDRDYDERLGEVLRPLASASEGRNLGFGIEIADRTTAFLREAMYLNTLTLPTSQVEMTAYEAGQRVQEYIRNALPLFEPMEYQYNGELCDITFDTLLHAGGFGSVDAIPEDIQGQETLFQFTSPLSELIERKKGQLFLEAKTMIAEAAGSVPEDQQADVVGVMDFGETLRDVLQGIGVPVSWVRGRDAVEQQQQARAEGQQTNQLLTQMEQGATVAERLSKARAAMADGM